MLDYSTLFNYTEIFAVCPFLCPQYDSVILSTLMNMHDMQNKCSAVANMRQRLAQETCAENWGRAVPPFLGGSWVPTAQFRLGQGLPPYQVAS